MISSIQLTIIIEDGRDLQRKSRETDADVGRKPDDQLAPGHHQHILRDCMALEIQRIYALFVCADGEDIAASLCLQVQKLDMDAGGGFGGVDNPLAGKIVGVDRRVVGRSQHVGRVGCDGYGLDTTGCE